MVKVAPSILAADFEILEEEIEDVVKAGADYIHVDVMDGEFVNNETPGLEMYERAIKLAPDIPDSYLNLVFAYDKVGKFNLATKLVETFIKKFPDNEAIELAKDYLDRRAEEDNDELINDDKGLPQSISSRKKKQKELEENIAENSADVNSDAETEGTDGTDEENA